MELYLPLVSPEDLDVIPTKIQLQFVRDSTSTDIAENTHKKKQREVVKELGLNLGSYENNAIKDILRSVQIGKIDRAVAFAKIKAECQTQKTIMMLRYSFGLESEFVQFNGMNLTPLWEYMTLQISCTKDSDHLVILSENYQRYRTNIIRA